MRPKAKSEAQDRQREEPETISTEIRRRRVGAVNHYDGNTASAVDAYPAAESSAQGWQPSTRPTSLSESNAGPEQSNPTAPEIVQTRRLASMAKDLRPSDSASSTGTNTRSGAALSREGMRASVGDTTTMRPDENALRPTNSQHRNMSIPDGRLRNSVTKMEELTREAIYLAHDAVDRQRPDEVKRIMEEAAHALHTSSHSRDVPQDLRNEPLLDAGDAVPRPNALHGRRTENDSTFSKNSSESEQSRLPPAMPQIPRIDSSATLQPPFKNEASPYHTPNLTVTAPASPKSTVPHAIDFAYKDQPLAEPVSPHTVPIDVRRRSKPKARFEDPPRAESAREPAPSSPALPSAADVHGYIDERSEPPVSMFPRHSSITIRQPRDSSSDSSPTGGTTAGNVDHIGQSEGHNWGSDKYDEHDYLPSSALDGKHHITLADHQIWSIHHHKRQPISRNWSTARKRATALFLCIETALVGFIVGIYAGEVPSIQYALNDNQHHVILGNVVLFLGMGLTTFFFWPLPLLHGRKPYTLVALGIALALQFPQAVMVSSRHVGNNTKYMIGILVPRAILGLALGFVHINLKTTLLDLFGASLQSTHPHGEFVVTDDIRRHGGGMGLWLGSWAFCWIGSLSLGFMIGADIISGLNDAWGFYITVILIGIVLLLAVLTPETRRAPHRRTMAEIELPNMQISRRVARGEITIHVYGDGPKWWWDEVLSGIYLCVKMLDQPGFGLMAIYLGWVYGEIVLIIVVSVSTTCTWTGGSLTVCKLLGNLLSVGYRWRPQYVGLGVLAICLGALLAIPNTKANFFSKSRVRGGRTDSMTFEPRVTWTSHMVRRAAFMVLLPVVGIAYTIASAGSSVHYMLPIVFAGAVGYLSTLAIAECHGLIMETFDTSDLQPGANSRHRLQSLPTEVKSRRTTYTSYPRVTAGLMIAHTIAFGLAAIATGVGGAVTRQIGAQKATGITAGALFGLTLLLTAALWRWKKMQVIPNHLFGDSFGSGSSEKRPSVASMRNDNSWRAVVVGNPSGKFRRMNLLELGGLSRWTEIRRLNRLLNRTTTQPLNPGWE